MSATKPFPWLELGVTAFCAVRTTDLLTAWQHAPLDHLGWIALIVWTIPLVRRSESSGAWKAASLIAALVLAVLATVTDLHVLGHVALACALASWRLWHWSTLLWLITAICWMPAFGWALRSLGADIIFFLRLAIAGAGSIMALLPTHSARRVAP